MRWFLFVGRYLSVAQNIYLPRDYYFLGWFLFVDMYLSLTQNMCLPRDYYFLGWFLFVGMYLSVTIKCLPRGFYFFGWFLFVGMFLSLESRPTQTYVSTSVHMPRSYFYCDGFFLCACFCQSLQHM